MLLLAVMVLIFIAVFVLLFFCCCFYFGGCYCCYIQLYLNSIKSFSDILTFINFIHSYIVLTMY